MIMIQHITQCSKNERNQRDERKRFFRMKLRQERTNRSACFYLNEGVIVLLERLLEYGEKSGEVILVGNGDVGSEIVDNGDSA